MNRRNFVGTILGTAVAAPLTGIATEAAQRTGARLDLATARTALLSGDDVVAVSMLVLIPGLRGGLRTSFVFDSPERPRESLHVDGMCFLDPDGERHGHVHLKPTLLDVHLEPVTVDVDLTIQMEMGEPRTSNRPVSQALLPAFAVDVEGTVETDNDRMRTRTVPKDPAPLHHLGYLMD